MKTVTMIAVAVALFCVVPCRASDRSFDVRDWVVSKRSEEGNRYVADYERRQTRGARRNDVLTHEILVDQRRAQIPAVLETLKVELSGECPSLKWKVIRETSSSAVYEWWHAGCAGYAPQYEIALISLCPEGLCRWGYSTHVVPLPAAVRETWIRVLPRLRAGGAVVPDGSRTSVAGTRNAASLPTGSGRSLAAGTPAMAAIGGPSNLSPIDTLLSARFQAQPFADPFTGLNYARGRWYDPARGAWLSPDPKGNRDSPNLYAFCGGDPINCRDPKGEQSRSELSDDRATILAKQRAEAPALAAHCRRDPLSPACQGDAGITFVELFGDRTASRLPRVGLQYSSTRPAGYMNGVNTSPRGARGGAVKLADLYSMPIDPLYNPTNGLVMDLVQAAVNDKMNGLVDASTRLIYDYLHEQVRTLRPRERLTFIAHSQAGAKASNALSFLTPDERRRIDLIVDGGDSWSYPGGLHSQHHVINPLDLVAMTTGKGPEGIARSLFGKTSEEEQFDWRYFRFVFPATHYLDNYIEEEIFLRSPAYRAYEERRREEARRRMDRK